MLLEIVRPSPYRVITVMTDVLYIHVFVSRACSMFSSFNIDKENNYNYQFDR